ncbi:hypothetical protein FG386_001026 [Cryptosporidium ryanae]|uniref:uncharacterized protein n=1 Tax=Cryptosporidium ryanae TaxID=515981 RepID=UPI00351A62DE|nr:hypothetical protein FG386_001026 [Cryptosporidium ryanae]
MNYNYWQTNDSNENIGFSYESLSVDNRNAEKLTRDNSLSVNQILIEDNVSPRPSEGLNSMRFSDLGDMTEEEWNKQQQRQNSQRYEKLYLFSDKESDSSILSSFGLNLQQKFLRQNSSSNKNINNTFKNNEVNSMTPTYANKVSTNNINSGEYYGYCGERGCVNSLQNDTYISYIWGLLNGLREKNTIRNKQAQLTLWEIVRQFYLVNNLFFILKVLKTIVSSSNKHRLNKDMGWVSFMCLISTFITSLLAYLSRSYIFYHRIEDKYISKLFSPIHVYSQIRIVGNEKPETLFMLERINWTYTLIMHILEDIPQLFASSIFLANYGNDFYAFFMITWSSCMIIATTIRMGVSYPLINTLSLIFSRNPPVDSPILNEATTTTIHFPLFIAIITFIWAVFDRQRLKKLEVRGINKWKANLEDKMSILCKKKRLFFALVASAATLSSLISSKTINETGNSGLNYSWFDNYGASGLTGENKATSQSFKQNNLRSNYTKHNAINTADEQCHSYYACEGDISFSYYHASENSHIRAWFHDFGNCEFGRHASELKSSDNGVQDKHRDEKLNDYNFTANVLITVLSSFLELTFGLFNDWKTGWKFVYSFLSDLVFN